MEVSSVIGLPDSKIVEDAREFARQSSEPYLFNHVMRTWLFAAILSKKEKVQPDPELLAVASLLHDLGLTEKYTTDDKRFEVDGADAARDFLRGYGLSDGDVQLVWDAIALHSTRSIALHKGPLVSMCHCGVQVDVSGLQYDEIDASLMKKILHDYPRLSFKKNLTSCLCEIIRRKPATTSDNFMRAFGERYVCDYHVLSPVDRLNDAPFDS